MSQAPIEYQRFRRGETCTEEGCRARKFYIEDGKKFCQRGHEQAGFTQTQQDEDDFNTQGKKTRKKKVEEEKVVTVLSGNDAKELYLQCLQLVIWKQCHWLIKAKGLPAEFETVVRDLWGLRVGVIWKDREKSQSAFGSQVFSSQSEGESTGTDATDGKSLSSRRSRISEEKLPKLRETLGLCYLGMLLMRLPVSLGEVWKWASRGEILFMRVIKEIPKEMRRKLPPYFYSALEMKAPLKGYTLHRIVGDLVAFFNHHFEMEFPQLNTHLLLYKHIQQLSLPVEIYPGVQRLASLLSITFSFPTVKPSSRYQTASSYPEIQLIALLIVTTKLLHPFDDIKRVPESDADPTSTRINWKEWTKFMVEPPSKDTKKGDEIYVKEMDVWNMDELQMDQYMDWYQRTWIDDRPPKLAEQILNMFPLPALSPQQEIESDSEKRDNRLKEVQHSLEVQRSWPMGDGESERIRRPGELYKRYKSAEEIPEMAKGFFELAARITGTSVKVLVKAVLALEARLEKWQRAERKNDFFERREGDESDEGNEDEDEDEDNGEDLDDD